VRTQVCDLLGIEHPIVQAPMTAVPELAAAVSNAGALGMLALTWSTPAGEVVRQTAALTNRPFGGNLVLESDQRSRLDEALEAGLRIVSLFWGDPADYVKPGSRRRGNRPSHGRERRRSETLSGQRSGWCGRTGLGGRWARMGSSRDPSLGARGSGRGGTGTRHSGGRDRRQPRGRRSARARCTSGVAGYSVPDGPGDAHPRGIPPSRHDAAETDTRWYADLYEVGWPNAPNRSLSNSTAEVWEAAGRPWGAGQEREMSSLTSHQAKR
jgi:hypothetical protein